MSLLAEGEISILQTARPGKENASARRKEQSEKNLQAVANVISANLAALHANWQPAKPNNHNIFLGMTAPELMSASQDSREATSRLGNTLEKISRDLAKLKYPTDLKNNLFSKSVSERQRALIIAAAKNKPYEETRVYTAFNKKEIAAAASRLTAYAKNEHKIGTKEFKAELVQEMNAIRSLPLGNSWYCTVDLACTNSSIGLVELKSGGQLDTTKAAKETEALIYAHLAHGDAAMPFHFATLYANKGEKKNIEGSLRSYFQHDVKTNPSTQLLVGKIWWKRVLPYGIKYNDFIQLYAKSAKRYPLLPYKTL